MKIIFFQDIISMHFAPFFRALSENNETFLFVEEAISKTRIDQGWEIPDVGKTKVYIEKDLEFIKNFILEEESAYFIFSSIHSIKKNADSLKYAASLHRSIGISSEGYKKKGIKGVLRFIRAKLFYLNYKKKIKFIFGMGAIGVDWYLKSGFSENVVHHWAYFTNSSDISFEKESIQAEQVVNLLFVGQLIPRKRILELIEVVKDLKGVHLNIIGNGELREHVINYAQTNDNIQYTGVLDNIEVKKNMFNSDLLVLPSVFDGWGAVVNESLLLGTPVLCTNTCGSSVLLDGEIRGESFEWSQDNLKKTIIKWKEKNDLRQNREDIIKWSENITASKAVNYFEKALEASSNTQNNKQIAPWFK